MTKTIVDAALADERVGFVTGITWLPQNVIEELGEESGAVGPAAALTSVATALALDFVVVPANEWWAAEAVADLHSNGIAAIWSVGGMLGRVGDRVGWSEMLRLTVSEPGSLAIHLGEVLHDALDALRQGISLEADALLIADDLAGATGPLVAPDFALDVLVPCYRSLVREGIGADIPMVFHSDGDIRTMFKALKRAGFSAVHLGGLATGPFAMSYAAARSADLVVLGGLEAAALRTGARRLGAHVASLALSGGMLVCDDGGMTSTEEVAAFGAALESARETYERGGGQGRE